MRFIDSLAVIRVLSNTYTLFLKQRSGVYCCWHDKVQHMFLLKTVSAAAAVHKPQQRADRYQDTLQATQMHTLFHKNMRQAGVGGIALWLQPKCFIFQHDIIIFFVLIWIFSLFGCKKGAVCFYSCLFWEVDLHVKLLLLCSMDSYKGIAIFINTNAVFKCCTFFILTSILIAWFPLDGTKALTHFQNGKLSHYYWIQSHNSYHFLFNKWIRPK